MTNEEQAGRYTGPQGLRIRIVTLLRSSIKTAITSAALWGLLPVWLADYLIRLLRLENA